MTPPTIPDNAAQDDDRDADIIIPGDGAGQVPVVGLGGSAGSIISLQQFFRGVPADTGLAFVVVIHLSAAHVSTLDELLQRCTPMPVYRLHGGESIQANHVYVLPPRMSVELEDGRLHLSELPEGRASHVVVDLFFRSLADSQARHAAAVVLSGADGDGSIGIKRIKERGGLTIVQDPDEATHPGMPRTAMQTGMVDWVLPVADIAPRLLAYFQLEKSLVLPPESGSIPTGATTSDEDAPLREVLAYLRTRTGRDFSSYKRATVVRRIARRMQVNGTDTLQGYLQCLRTTPGEPGALLQDLLISVTNFFRDPRCFEALDKHLVDIVRAKPAGEPLRVWVAGCATGEEAYSMAILLSERVRTLDVTPVIQIFASDLDEEAIRAARDGLYPATIEADVSEERLRRFFVREHRGYRVRREIRELVLFAHHDLLRDSPFSRLDVITCRNLLIYLDRTAQQRVFQTLHFAALPHARLFLGASETIDEASGLFMVLEKQCRIYARRPLSRAVLPTPHGPSMLVQTLQYAASHPLVPLGKQFDATSARGWPDLFPRGSSMGELHLRLMESLGPPSVLIDGDHEILHLSRSAGRLLQFGGGEPSRGLLRVVHPALRLELRAALYQAAQGKQATEVAVEPVDIEGMPAQVVLRVTPIQEAGADLFIVTFDARAPRGEPASNAPTIVEPDPVARHLDRELERLKQHLRDTVEQYEASTEELKASNEELQAMNEELRSATEELETSREELQSINEELSTVNQELKSKVEELGDANSDMQNLMNATAIATVFLDRELQVMRYTPSAVGLFNLIPTDIGRPLSHLSTRLQYPQLADDATRVLETLVPVEREVGLADGRWFMARLLPYRTLDDRIAGVVLSFIDITERKQAEEMRLWLSAVVNSSGDAIVSFAPDGTVLSWNGGAESIFGYSAGEMIGQPLERLLAVDDDPLLFQQVAAGQTLSLQDIVRRRKDGSHVHVSINLSPIHDHDGRIIGGTAIARDISAARNAAQALRESDERLRLVMESATEFAIYSLDLERRIAVWNQGAQRVLGYAEHEVLGHSGDIVFTPEDRAAGVPQREAQAALAEGRAGDDRWHVRKDGSRFWASGATMPMRNVAGEAVGFVKILRDQTAARAAQEALELTQRELMEAAAANERQRAELQAADVAKDRFLAVLSHELRNPLASINAVGALLAEPSLSGSDHSRAGQVVRRQAAAMKALLDDLLDVSRLRTGRMELHPRPIGIGDIVRSALESTRPLVEQRKHALSVSLPANELEVDADPLRMSQVIANLLANAAKYTPPGGEIRLSAQLHGAEVVVAVHDNGIGMQPEQTERMFEMFTQAPEALQHAAGGLGIGLALARSIVELHGGWIRATSAGPGRGCSVTLGLPLLRTVPARHDPADAEPVAPAPSTAGELVLVADDNPDVIWGMTKLLEKAGHRTLAAAGGQEALRLATEHQPSVLVLDLGMPDLDGREVARRVRALPWGRQALLVAATGWGQEHDMRRSLDAGFDAHLTKPVHARQLLQLIAERRRADA